jgi:hypothetical protein
MSTLTPVSPASVERSQGLICPGCSGVVPVAEGFRIVECPYCHRHSLVQGDRGIRRWQVARRIERAQAETSVRAFFSGIRKARDLKRTAVINEIFLVYLPFWRVEATVAGWLFGRVRKDKDETKPDEHYVFESMHWNDAAVDVTEFGVHRVVISRDDLKPFDSQALHAEAMVFEPTESRTEAFEEAREYFIYRSHQDANQTSTFYENIQLLRPEFGLLYYPVWLARYSYRNRTYQVVIDAVSGKTMYGKAPGETLYRAAALVAGLAAGNMILVNGTILAGLLASGDDEGGSIIFLPIILGIALIFFGYRQFRYGEEVEDKPKEFQKAATASGPGLLGEILSVDKITDLFTTGMTVLDDMQEKNRKTRPR